MEDGQKVEDTVGTGTYRHHREEDESGRSGFLSAVGRINQAIDGGGRQN